MQHNFSKRIRNLVNSLCYAKYHWSCRGSASSWRYVASKDAPTVRGAQIDLVIDRGDHVINVCEIKFSKGRFALGLEYAETVRNRIQLFRDKTGTTKATMCTFVTTFGVGEGLHNGVIDNEVVAEDLFV